MFYERNLLLLYGLHAGDVELSQRSAMLISTIVYHDSISLFGD
jgi:hypothetical protein